MVFRLVYRPGLNAELRNDRVDVDTFEELFAAVGSRVGCDPCKLCTVLNERMEKLCHAGQPQALGTELF